MAVFTFVVKKSKETWTAKQYGGEDSLEESAASTFELERKLIQRALQTAGSNSVSSNFSFVTPTSAVAQVILGGGGGGGGSASLGETGASGGAGSAPAPVEEEKKEEEKEESDEEMGFSLFDD